LALLIYSKGLSRRDIAEKVNLPYDTVVRLTNGRTVFPAARVASFAQALDIDPLQLLDCLVSDMAALENRREMRTLILSKIKGKRGRPRKQPAAA
jgi:transcriptional regulator with XRE-family HTH domain